MPLKVNLSNLVEVLQSVIDVYRLGLHLGIENSALNRIRHDFPAKNDQLAEMLQWWLKSDLNCTWKRVISALKVMNRTKLAAAVTVVSRRESLHEPPRKESKRWGENLKIVVSLEEKLGQLQQHSEHVNKEWEKDERKWCEYLETEGQKAATKALVKPSHECKSDAESESNSELLYQCSELTQNVEQHVKRKRDLRGFCERATEHQRKLQETKMELNKLKEALAKQELELQERVDQMEELGGGFSEEANDCREWLQKSQEQQQTCEKKIHECRDELSQQQRQVQKYQKKLEECEVILKKCRDELGDSHSNLTQYIEGLKTKSKNLLDEIKRKQALPAANAGALFGRWFGYETLGETIGFLTDLLAGGSKEHVAVSMMISEEAKTKLRRCEMELKKCSEVVKKCEEVLRNSDKELKGL